MVKRANQHPAWRTVFGSVNNRAKDEELIVRFLALYRDGELYSRPMNKFLNDFSAKMNRTSEHEIQALEREFKSTIDVVEAAIGYRAFRLIRALNAAVFDAVMVGIAKRVDAPGHPSTEKITAAYDVLIADENFRAACERATADEESVRTRRTMAIDAFART